MPARLVALHPARGSSRAVAGECWIESDITRIGAAADAELRIDKVEPLLATVRYRDGQYLVYRRSNQALLLGGRALPLNEPIPWPPGLILAIGDRLSLVLTVEANPAPAPRPLVVLAEDLVGPAATGWGAWNRRVRQLLVALPILVLSYSWGSSQPAAPRLSNQFAAVQQALDARDPDRPRTRTWRERLQEARLQELGGHAGKAYQTHAKLRDSLLDAKFSAKPALSETEEQVLAFVGEELNRLRGKRSAGW